MIMNVKILYAIFKVSLPVAISDKTKIAFCNNLILYVTCLILKCKLQFKDLI